MNNYLEIVDRDGLPALCLIPSVEDHHDVALQVDYASEGDDNDTSSNGAMSPNATAATSPSSNVTSEPDSNEKDFLFDPGFGNDPGFAHFVCDWLWACRCSASTLTALKGRLKEKEKCLIMFICCLRSGEGTVRPIE